MEERPCEEKIREIFTLVEERYGSLEDFARDAVVPVSFLEDLRAGRWERMPEAVYVRGFLKRISDRLGMDYKEIEKAFSQCMAPKDVGVSITSVRIVKKPSVFGVNMYVFLGVIAVIVAVFFLVYLGKVGVEGTKVGYKLSEVGVNGSYSSLNNTTGGESDKLKQKRCQMTVRVLGGKTWYRWINGDVKREGFLAKGEWAFSCNNTSGCYMKLGNPGVVVVEYMGDTFSFNGTKPVILKVAPDKRMKVLRGGK